MARNGADGIASRLAKDVQVEPLKIAFVIASLGCGGAERVASLLANAWSMRGHGVSIVTFEAPGVRPAYALSNEVSLIPLNLSSPSKGLGRAMRNNWRRISSLRRCLQGLQPDVVVSFITETNVLTVAAGFRAPWPTIVSERIHPAYHPLDPPWARLRQAAYSRAAAVVTQTDDIASWLRKKGRAETHVIPNPVDLKIFVNGAESRTSFSERKRLVAVGRLDHQKGFDILIDAFAKAATRIRDWDLEIFGEGPLDSKLQRQIDILGMASRISLKGASRDVAATYRSADAFVHAARYEGYPNVVVEALAAGLPVIATDSPGAVRDLLSGGTFGVLVPPEDAAVMAEALVVTLNDERTLAALSCRAREAVRYNDVEVVSEAWLSLFRSAVVASDPFI
jgi:glycosyltransferase involved in cell wall biosynthesis